MSMGAIRWLWMRNTRKKTAYCFQTVKISLQSKSIPVCALRTDMLITGAMNSMVHSTM